MVAAGDERPGRPSIASSPDRQQRLSEDHMSADHAALARAFFAASDHHRAPAELCTAGFVAHFPGVAAMDLEAYEQFMTLFHAPFTGLHHRIDDVIAADAAVAVRLRFEGLHTGD